MSLGSNKKAPSDTTKIHTHMHSSRRILRAETRSQCRRGKLRCICLLDDVHTVCDSAWGSKPQWVQAYRFQRGGGGKVQSKPSGRCIYRAMEVKEGKQTQTFWVCWGRERVNRWGKTTTQTQVRCAKLSDGILGKDWVLYEICLGGWGNVIRTNIINKHTHICIDYSWTLTFVGGERLSVTHWWMSVRWIYSCLTPFVGRKS